MRDDHSHPWSNAAAVAKDSRSILFGLNGFLLATVAQQNQIQFLHLLIKRVATRIRRIDSHRVWQPLDDTRAASRPFFQLSNRIGPVGIDRNVRHKHFGMPFGYFKNVIVRNIKFGLIEICRTVRAIVFVERKQPVFAVTVDMAHEIHETLNKLSVSRFFVRSAGGAHVDFELKTMKRMFPRPHLSINKSSTCTEARDVNVVIDQPLRINSSKARLTRSDDFALILRAVLPGRRVNAPPME